MRRDIAAAMAISAVALSGIPAQAQSKLSVPGNNTLRSFLPVEVRFASALSADGVGGLKREAAPGFIVRHGNEHWTGEAALAQIDYGIHGTKGGKVAITVRHLTITGDTAVALTKALLTDHPMTVNGISYTSTGTWYWKQTWQRTGQEWKLAVLEYISEKEFGPAPMVEYTVWSVGHIRPLVGPKRVSIAG